jgi:mycothiol synthase
MKLIRRNFQDENDYWRMRAFLRETLLLNGMRQVNWHVARLDYWRWHVILNCNACPPLEQVTMLWETDEGQIAAVLNPEGTGDAFLQMHPAYRTPELEREMLDVAEEKLAPARTDGRHRLCIYVHTTDTLWQSILTQRGYTIQGDAETQWRRDVTLPIPTVPIAPGYAVRPLGDVSELPSRSWASWRAFHPDEPNEKYQGWEWYHNIQRQPLYRRDLDIVTIAPAGEVAGFCTVWYDDVTRSAYFEAVGTMPEHQKRGLGKAMLNEGLRRLVRMGATTAFVSGYGVAPNALYRSVMGPDHEVVQPWVKEW